MARSSGARYRVTGVGQYGGRESPGVNTGYVVCGNAERCKESLQKRRGMSVVHSPATAEVPARIDIAVRCGGGGEIRLRLHLRCRHAHTAAGAGALPRSLGVPEARGNGGNGPGAPEPDQPTYF